MSDIVIVLVQGCPKTAEDDEKFALFGKLDDVIGVLANYFQVLGLSGVGPLVSLAISALQKPTPSPEIAILEHIGQQIDDLMSFAGALESEVKMLSLVPMVTPVAGALETLQREGAAGPHVDAAMFFQQSLDLVEALTDDVYWYRPLVSDRVLSFDNYNNLGPWAEFGVENDPPFRLFPPVNESLIEGYKAVFDPGLAMPAFLKAIESFVAINGLLDPSGFDRFLNQWKDKISEWADFLEDVYDGSVSLARGERRVDTLIGGLLKSSVPSSTDDIIHYITNRGFGWVGIYGVVDLYAAYENPVTAPSLSISHIVDVFTREGIGRMSSIDNAFIVDSVYPWVRMRVVLGLMARWKAVYQLRGYDKVWSVLQKLRVLAKQQGSAANDANNNWSVRELIDVINTNAPNNANTDLRLTLHPGATVAHDYYSLADLVDYLDEIATSTWDRPLFGFSQNGSNRPVSFRDRLAAAAA
jgi:hypothetical protein